MYVTHSCSISNKTYFITRPYGDVSDDGQNFVNPNSESESIDLWKIGTSIHLRNFYDEDDAGDKGPVMFIHGDTLILGGGNKKATIWRIANGGKMQYLEHDKKITGLAVSLLVFF